MPDLEISGHAIDRASLLCRKIWHKTRKGNEGISSWLHRMCKEAIEKTMKDVDGNYVYNDMIFSIEDDGVWPVLKTVKPEKKKIQEKDTLISYRLTREMIRSLENPKMGGIEAITQNKLIERICMFLKHIKRETYTEELRKTM